MYPVALVVHSLLRWLVLVAVLGRTARGATGWATGAAYGKTDRILALVAMITVDLQMTLGFLLFGVSPRVAAALADPAAAMKEASLRQVLVEHPVLMIGAVVAVHVGFAFAKRAADDRRKHRASALGFGLGAVLALAGIPWR